MFVSDDGSLLDLEKLGSGLIRPAIGESVRPGTVGVLFDAA